MRPFGSEISREVGYLTALLARLAISVTEFHGKVNCKDLLSYIKPSSLLYFVVGTYQVP